MAAVDAQDRLGASSFATVEKRSEQVQSPIATPANMPQDEEPCSWQGEEPQIKTENGEEISLKPL